MKVKKISNCLTKMKNSTKNRKRSKPMLKLSKRS